MTASVPDPLLISLAGTTLATPTSPVDPSKPVVASGTSTNDVVGSSGLLESAMSQSVTSSVEGVGKSIVSANKLEDLANQHTTSATGDSVATVSLPTVEQQSDTAKTASDIVDTAQPNKGVPLTALQGQQIENVNPHQGVPIKDYQEKEVAPASAPSAPVVVQGQEGAEQAVTAARQSTLQHQEEASIKLDQAPVQQMLGKGELSLHQKHIQVPTPASEAQAVAAVSSHIQDEGQGLNSGLGSKGKDVGLKWLSHVELQSAEMSSRTSEPSTVESGDGGHQYSSYQQGQGGTPPNIRPASASSVPVPSQTNQLSPDPEPTPVPRTHAVQFDMAPADFGQLRVRVVLSDHTIHTHLSTDRAELGQMLTGQQEQLSTQLTAAGLDLGRFQVQVGQERSHESGQDWQSQAHSDTTQQQRDPRQQDRPQEGPAPQLKRAGVLSLFA
ncbi:MAG: flagellar hook-length control protein FliK [Nitrospiraceae bacterium]